ncbi:phosphocholine cytidylyltransferase family protein [Dokdonia donghaensis]|uniref:UDP-N-acetylglucosamine pyrophosphorylase n=1 Tax=Dokdonia donghaensis DSW-1 TaxID=1300343 RepID=A0A0A2GU99_9FLAO|nr:phosphocholine cytidylyltransferase family protein [Dokdonia donghaensis]ANH61497.1 2-C-methyl-D-erythritol 4-phosphate cytidylyltransferase [Dokdonia donghaensis DSW-1]KGO06103.1 UDP-N-acetylglucosamine pyrophosphorylase [Dokdonia donghaensis DSW-1]
MKTIILAAGIGSRLGNPYPKALTPLKNGKSIMEMMVESLSSYFSINDLLTVVGFKKNSIMERFPDITYIYNPYFDTTNTSKSLLCALKKCRDESVLWLNGDVVFDPLLLNELVPHIEKDQSFVAVNTCSVADEEVKYTLEDGYIQNLSKEVINGLGEAVGINYISAKDVPLFIKELEACEAQDYFEKGLEVMIAKHQTKIQAVDISKFNCMEVDFKEDLEHVNSFL